MYKRLSAVMFPIAAILFVGAIVWGYQEHQEKNAILIKAENQYQRAFHDLTTHMSGLQDQLGRTLAVNSASQGMQRKGLVNVWRLTSEAQNEINQLPLALLPFNKAEDFLSRISDFAYRTSVRDLTKQPLTNDEMKMMKSLYAKSSDINQELGKVQDAVLSDHLRWMDVEVAMASTDSTHDNSIIDGFKAVDKKVSAYPEHDWGPSSMSTSRKRSVKMLSGQDATPEEIKRKALEFAHTTIHNGAGTDVKVVENGRKTDNPSYTATFRGPKGENIQMDYTVKGGQLLSFMNPRDVTSRKLDVGAARERASQFLDSHGYKDMTPVTYDEYDHVSVFTFVGTKDNVRIYPDKVTVRIALDNGEAVGLQAADHVYRPKSLSVGKPKIARAEAQKVLNPEFKVQSYNVSIIENEEKKEVLCHEFTGKINGSQYRIFVNADTGIEETIEQIPESAKAILK
ncbi:germination protein YpeB [Cohnella nanjingensis]|uniref:Germination protein YpeB n=1 Tax=Cohnella nanjingensis TaxID=1387779 RepID=A0A7X0VHR0_9BACL|nr:germination protein YpeB [Cohnella nanjingensis]MBB6674171.1 germination protein YpeB [Cohnella nanjingensis]